MDCGIGRGRLNRTSLAVPLHQNEAAPDGDGLQGGWGGAAVELINGRQSIDQTQVLERLARDFELEVSAGSDFHADRAYGAQLGVESRLLNKLPGVWERWSSTKNGIP